VSAAFQPSAGRRAAFDAHVHLHPYYDLGGGLRDARDRLLAAAGGGGIAVLCLTEAAGCDMFDALRQGRADTPGWSVETIRDDRLLRLRRTDGGGDLWILAGRQIAARERIEALGLGLTEPAPDGLAAADTIRRVRDAGALPVLPWAPGKWFFERGRIVAGLMDAFGPDEVALADTTLRPIGWPEPALFHRARRDGFRILAGSDPLPFAGEEKRIGRYATAIDGEPRDDMSADAFLRLLGPGGPPAELAGSRGCPVDTAFRLMRHMAAKRRARRPDAPR